MAAPIQVVPHELSYQHVTKNVPSYRYRTVYPEGGQPTQAASSSVQSVFRFGAGQVLNPARCRLKITHTSAQETHYSVLHLWAPPIASISCMTSGGTALFDIADYRAYARAVLKANHFLPEAEEMNTYLEPAGALCRSETTSASFINHSGTIAASTRSYFPAAEYVVSADNTAISVSWDVDFLRLLPHTPLALDKDLWFVGQDIILTINFAQTADVGINSSTGATNFGTTAVPTAGAYSAVSLQVAMEDNQQIAASVKQEILQNGLVIPSQRPWMDSSASGSATAFSRVLKFNMGHGNSLLRHYFISVPANGNVLRYNPYNVGGVAWSAAQWFINQTPLSDGALSLSDYHKGILQRQLKGTFLASDYTTWLCYGAGAWDFSGEVNLRDQTPKTGVSLAQPVDLQVSLTLPAEALTVWSVVVTQKDLVLNAAGVSF